MNVLLLEPAKGTVLQKQNKTKQQQQQQQGRRRGRRGQITITRNTILPVTREAKEERKALIENRKSQGGEGGVTNALTILRSKQIEQIDLR